ncbi:MAG: ribosome small subunit-dependent GTPase A [Chitinophagales bacterium]|nr:ribosome small subunit-dependent GTPase A [Bacteroidota bacterium]MCB9226137.1 ribosome small subunit-dependent GTPase A [Chitinophagales bacterium]
MKKLQAKVVKSTGAWYDLISEDGMLLKARLKGNLRLEGLSSTNPVAVGDNVTLTLENGDWMIGEIADRENYIIRKSPSRKGQYHILAANIDQAFLLITISKPRTSTGFIDRFLVTAEAYQIPSILVFNKQDALTEKDKIVQDNLIETYTEIGYECLLVSSKTGEGIKEIIENMKGKTTLLAGHSGVGKSTFANAIDNNLDLRTAEVSKKYEKGRHTTTFAEMFPLKFGGNIIDIPGIKEFGLVDFEEEDISHFFPEMASLLPECKFNNCMHINEPDCAVLAALEEGKITEFRYQNYLNMVNDINEEKEY